MEPGIVRHYYIGNTEIIIRNDAYINKTEDDFKLILQRVAEIVYQSQLDSESENKDK